MKLFRILFIVLYGMFCYASLVQAADDNEYWSGYTLSYKVNDKVKLNLVDEFYFKSNMGDFYTFVQYAGISYALHKHFDIALWYKLVSSKTADDWSETHRFDVDGILKLTLNEFKLSNRSRFERNMTSSSWLYRDRIKIERPIELSNNRSFSPFVSNEFFLDIEPNSGYHENRASIGFSTDFIWGSTLSIYYMSRAKKSEGNWNNTNIIGTTIGFSF